MVGADVFIEDLNSTNGTYINGKAIKKQLLSHNDTVEIGAYKIKYLVEDGTDYEKTMIMKPGQCRGERRPAAAYQPTQGLGTSGFGSPLGGGSGPASIMVLNGAAAGREVMSPRWSPPSASPACRWPDHQAPGRLRVRPRRRPWPARRSTATR